MSTNTKLFEEKTYDEKHCLDVETAMYRSSIIENVSYKVFLALPKGSNFFGHTTTTLTLKELPTKTISLDHAGLKISSLIINGTLVENKDGDSQQIFTKHMIFLPTQYLKVQPIIISFSSIGFSLISPINCMCANLIIPPNVKFSSIRSKTLGNVFPLELSCGDLLKVSRKLYK